MARAGINHLWSAAKLPEISRIEPNLTLEGLRLVWEAGRATE
jgi:hypothetical protein